MLQGKKQFWEVFAWKLTKTNNQSSKYLLIILLLINWLINELIVAAICDAQKTTSVIDWNSNSIYVKLQTD